MTRRKKRSDQIAHAAMAVEMPAVLVEQVADVSPLKSSPEEGRGIEELFQREVERRDRGRQIDPNDQVVQRRQEYNESELAEVDQVPISAVRANVEDPDEQHQH